MRLLATLCLMLLAATLQAQTAPPTDLLTYSPTLSWCPSPDAVKYRVKMGASSGQYSVTRDTSDAIPVFHVEALQAGTYYFVVAALDATGNESADSNEVSIVVAPPPNPGPRVTLLLVPYISTTQATIVWQTDQECSGTAWWSTDQINWKSGKANNLGTNDHLYAIGGLLSRTHYFYKVTGDCSGQSIQSDVRSFNSK